MRKKLIFGRSGGRRMVCDEDGGDGLFKKPSFIESVNNRIYFYSEIDFTTSLQLNRSLRETQNSLISDKIIRNSPNYDPIFLHINSPGGSLHDGMAVADEILSLQVPVCTIVDGICASAATLISIVAKRRLIKKHSYMLIHQFSDFHWGTYEQLKDEALNDEKVMTDLRAFYKEHTKIPETELVEILKHDFMLRAEECIKYGLADEIY